jgi:antitoxin component of RelBE/YafQ-DinJ toxin-antitoxin module
MGVFTMAVIEINVGDDTLQEAERVLNSIGMDIEIAVNVFLRRVAIEKGLPMSMAASVPSEVKHTISYTNKESSVYESIPIIRKNNSITVDMVEEVWVAFLRYFEGSGEISGLSDEVSEKSGMNRGSAFIYLTVLSKWVKGESNTRVLKFKDLKFLMNKIKTDLGENEYQNALQSLKKTIPYWEEKIPGTFAKRVDSYCKEH